MKNCQECAGVCCVAQELLAFLRKQRSWLGAQWAGSAGGAGSEGRGAGPGLLSQLMGALLKCSDPEVARPPSACHFFWRSG